MTDARVFPPPPWGPHEQVIKKARFSERAGIILTANDTIWTIGHASGAESTWRAVHDEGALKGSTIRNLEILGNKAYLVSKSS